MNSTLISFTLQSNYRAPQCFCVMRKIFQKMCFLVFFSLNSSSILYQSPCHKVINIALFFRVEYWNRTNLDGVASRRLKTTRPTQHLPLCTEGEIWTHMPPLILSTPYESEGILRYNVGRMMGFEPMTTRFTVWRSTRWATYSMCRRLAGRERIEHSSLVLETNILYH